MCARCEARANDPRSKAFFQAGLVTIVPQTEKDKQPNPEGEYDGLGPLGEIKAYLDTGLAKFESFTMMRDPDLASVTHGDYLICLN